MFQSPIGWGLSCETPEENRKEVKVDVSIPYWLGSKLRGKGLHLIRNYARLFQSPIGWGLSCESHRTVATRSDLFSFNPLLVGV